MRVFGEFSPLLKSYWFLVTSKKPIHQVLLTPCPEGLYIRIDDRTVFVKTLVPVVSTEDALVRLETRGAYIRVSCKLSDGQAPVQPTVPQHHESIHRIACKQCGGALLPELQDSFPLPTTSLEVLNELWSCHPSHHQEVALTFRDN